MKFTHVFLCVIKFYKINNNPIVRKNQVEDVASEWPPQGRGLRAHFVYFFF